MRFRPAVAALAALAALSACTSSSSTRRSSAPPTSPSVTHSSTAAPTSGPPTQTTAPTGLATLSGALLLLGPAASGANVYEVTAGGLRQLTHVSGRGVAVAGVTANVNRVVVADNAVKHTDRIDEVRQGGSLHDLGIGPAFTPTLSAAGALAWVALDQSNQTPGISKPKAFVVGVRNSLTGATRMVYRTPQSIGSPQWIGTHQLVVPVSDGVNTRIMRLDTAGGVAKVLTTIADSAALNLVAGTKAVAVTDDDGKGVVLSLDGQTRSPLPTGWSPLCWHSGTSLLVVRSGHLATIAVRNGIAARPADLATIPSGLNAYGAACARIER
jgi:hypothetical protein